MALQKWAAPAYTLQSTLTVTGPDTTLPSAVNFASSADIAVGATMKLFMAGTITTTGSPTVAYKAAAFDTDAATSSAAAPSGVTDQPWTIEATYVVRSVSSGSVDYAYHIKVSGLLATDVESVGVVTSGTLAAIVNLGVAWDSGAADADSGDVVTTLVADALWIG